MTTSERSFAVLRTVFERYELKYMLTSEQKERLCRVLMPYMEPTVYGRTTVRNLYFDTDSYRLVRRSIERPAYKEKLRVRSYAQATCDSTVFAELKKKYDGVVYKRRLPLCEQDAMRWMCGEAPAPVNTQISREIDYFMGFYGALKPTVFLSYEREAYEEKQGNGDFRVTFDERILCRQTELSLTSALYGMPLLDEGKVLMELKCFGGLPLWMTAWLSSERLYKTRFSKYGSAYERLIYPKLHAKKSTEQKETVLNG